MAKDSAAIVNGARDSAVKVLDQWVVLLSALLTETSDVILTEDGNRLCAES